MFACFGCAVNVHTDYIVQQGFQILPKFASDRIGGAYVLQCRHQPRMEKENEVCR